MDQQSLQEQFYDLKAEVLKRMKPRTYLHFYMNGQGSGFILDANDELSHKFSMAGTPSVPFDIDEVVDAYQTHIKKKLSRDECLHMAINRFKEILVEMDKAQKR